MSKLAHSDEAMMRRIESDRLLEEDPSLYRCCGCGLASIDETQPCECATDCGYRGKGESLEVIVWKVTTPPATLGTAEGGEAKGVWPNFIAPAQYENPAPGWEDPRLPDFRLIWEAARSVGYAVGLHGSMKRDVDLIAVPWTESAGTAQDVIDAIGKAIGARPIPGRHSDKPHGRFALNLDHPEQYAKHLDLSIMPRLATPSLDAQGLVEALILAAFDVLSHDTDESEPAHVAGTKLLTKKFSIILGLSKAHAAGSGEAKP